MQQQVLRVGMRALVTQRLSARELEHYRAVQPTPAARVGVAMFPVEIAAARPLLATLERTVPARLGSKPALIVWGMRDWGFRAGERERIRAAFTDHVVVELPRASHFIQEDASVEIADAIALRFLG